MHDRLEVRSFELLERDLGSGCHEIGVEGDLDLSVAPEFKHALERAASRPGLLLIDLSGCEFMDSTGIALIVEARKRANGDAGRIAIHGASGQVLRVLSVTGLTENGLVFETAEEAIAAL
jgi:anti-sigma B factor antagonist